MAERGVAGGFAPGGVRDLRDLGLGLGILRVEVWFLPSFKFTTYLIFNIYLYITYMYNIYIYIIEYIIIYIIIYNI